MNMTLTDKQYKKLIRLVYMGNRMVNSFRDKEDEIGEFEETEEYVYSFHKQCGCEDMIEEADGVYYPTSLLEESVEEYIKEYEDDAFWRELVMRLTKRDLIRAYGEKKAVNMDIPELLEKMQPVEEKYN